MKVFSLLSTAALTTCLAASGFCNEESPQGVDFRIDQSKQMEMTIAQNRNSQNYQNNGRSSVEGSRDRGRSGARVINSAHGCAEQGFSIEAEFLWWRANLDNLEYAIRLSGSSSTPFNIGGAYRIPDFEFAPGVRLSAGYDFGRNNWDIFGRWTYHYTDPTSSTSSPDNILVLKDIFQPNSLISSVVSNALAGSAKAKWQNQINVGDFEMGYDYFFSCLFSFRPSFGLKAAWINMDYNTNYVDANVDGMTLVDFSFRNKSEWWGVGPQVGMDGHLHMGWGFSLYGRVSGALMYGKYDTRFSQTDSTDNRFRVTSSSEYRQRAMTQMLVGLEWAKCFSGDILLAFNIGWEGQYWWNQHEMRTTLDSQPHGDLTFTGLDVGVRLDF